MSPAEIKIRSVCWPDMKGRDKPATCGPVSLEVRPGEFVSLLGPPRSGKSALIRLIAGLQQPSSGEILVSGNKVETVQKQMGVVLSSPALLPWRTALENVVLQGEIRRLDLKSHTEAARHLLVMLGLEGMENRRPGELSPAPQVRVALSRALVHGPEALLLDDPFCGLDALEREVMSNDFQRLIQSRPSTVIFTTSLILEAVQLSDRVAVLSPEGRIVQEIRVELPRPRRLDKATYPQIMEYCSSIRKTLQASGVLH
jgi:NitT/TauT family transport system ATP-binding protein